MGTLSHTLLHSLYSHSHCPQSPLAFSDCSSCSSLLLSFSTPPQSLFRNLSSPSPAIPTRIRCTNLQDPPEPTTIKGSGSDGKSEEDAGTWPIVSSCLVGLVTGLGVVVFNNGVHELRDFFWDGIPSRGASWLREAPIEATWSRVILVPACGGLIVGMLNLIRSSIDGDGGGKENRVKAVLRPVLKAVAACVTLGTGNSLGPEGPSVEIGASVAKGVGNLFNKSSLRKPSLVAAGSAAGISSGFNAAVAGCFFAVESVLWPSPPDSSLSLTNTTSTVILSAVIASIVSEVGLGSEPAFKVPVYDFRSPGELPLYLLLGVICGLVSLALSRCTSYMLTTVDSIQESTRIPRAAFPVLGGLSVGLIALAYPEILYWGFENVDILLESRPFVKGLSAELLVQLVAVKIVATSLCRASGLVGGYYAPSLFIGAATGTAYGKLISYVLTQSNPIIDLSVLEVASPRAYGLVGMAATLAGVCQVPLTAVLLLFELTQDYRIVLPLLGAVGLSSWITSGQSRRKDIEKTRKHDNKVPTSSRTGETLTTTQQPPRVSSPTMSELPTSSELDERNSGVNNLCDIESSLCLEESGLDVVELERKTSVSQAMRTRYVTISMNTKLSEAVNLMLAEKQSGALIVDADNILIGLLTLGDIEELSRSTNPRKRGPKERVVSELCSSVGGKCRVPWTAVPSMSLRDARVAMNRHEVSQVPVVSEYTDGHRGQPVGILDTESITLTCRFCYLQHRLRNYVLPIYSICLLD
ncbi:chloride channel protein CLC-e isoform X1 [Punica granatum]|uniref:Chloride channel protein n=1 Tax=Punica granatum TaxID=22663 RepID=A0A6P8CFM8_PUNGR|nr:chloride channel protein CLC-e isoform X1 [Punica granatum]